MSVATQAVETKTLFSVDELTDRWSLSRSMVYRLMDEGKVASVRIGAAKRVHIDEVLRFEAGLM